MKNMKWKNIICHSTCFAVLVAWVSLGLSACNEVSPPDPSLETGWQEKCSSTQTCVYDTCVDANRVCGLLVCPVDQSCVDGSCVNNSELCGGQRCGDHQTCLQGICQDNQVDPCEKVSCQALETCFQGQCYDNACLENGVPKQCDNNLVCSKGRCVTEACIDVMCVTGTHCDNGNCVKDDPCVGVVCSDENTVCHKGECVETICLVNGEPMDCGVGFICSHGECVDDGCENILCDVGEVCVKAKCVDELCIDTFCAEGQSCQAGKCMDNECLNQSCSTGEYCAKGVCLPAECLDVECLQGKICVKGGVCSFENPPSLVVTLENEDAYTDEDGKTVTLLVALNHEPAQNVQLTCEISNPQEAKADCNLTFDSTNWSVPQNITVSGLQDVAFDGDVEYDITIKTISEDPEFHNLTHSEKLTNIDKTTLGVFVTSENDYITSENGTSVVLDIVLTAAPQSPISFTVNSDNTNEATLDKNTITFSPENWNVPQTITVTGQEDNAKDGDQVYNIIFGDIETEDPNYLGITIPSLAFLNQDNDVAGVTIPQKIIRLKENALPHPLPVVLGTSPQSEVHITIASSNETEATTDPKELLFDPNNWNQTQYINVTPVQDNIIDDDQDFQLSITVASEDPDYASIAPITIHGINANTDKAGVNIVRTDLNTTLTEGDETPASFQVSLTSIPTADVTLNLLSLDNTELEIVSEPTLFFTAENWDELQTVMVASVDDDIVDGPQKNAILISGNSLDKNYAAFSSSIASYTVEDNDSVGIHISGESTKLRESTEQQANFAITLNSEPTHNITVTLTSSDPTALKILKPVETSLGQSTLTITPKNWNLPHEITVAPVDNELLDTTERQATIAISLKTSDKLYDNMTASSPTYVILDKE